MRFVRMFLLFRYVIEEVFCMQKISPSAFQRSLHETKHMCRSESQRKRKKNSLHSFSGWNPYAMAAAYGRTDFPDPIEKQPFITDITNIAYRARRDLHHRWDGEYNVEIIHDSLAAYD